MATRLITIGSKRFVVKSILVPSNTQDNTLVEHVVIHDGDGIPIGGYQDETEAVAELSAVLRKARRVTRAR